METKICIKCSAEKQLDEFARKRGSRSNTCKACHNAYYKEYWQNTEAYERHKKRVNEYRRNNPYAERARKYGLSSDEVKEILAANDGLCLICNEQPATCIDHCHRTQAVRGGLCTRCNTGIGMLRDDPEVLMSAAAYLRGSIPSVL